MADGSRIEQLGCHQFATGFAFLMGHLSVRCGFHQPLIFYVLAFQGQIRVSVSEKGVEMGFATAGRGML
jgi:hypothetical protein